ncbi:Rrf2 family transcriptional regulator [Paenibacillus sp. FSL M7-1455]|uniref:Rrf2 family transcriptional regulator n=1 Tax=Paenibacillus cookii TaxID=157839 RepID=A0ABQ4M2F4_9BACL|nr:Rrf2 family transcriptional regulator [Paenibacillus cookii]GIO69677.1 Rrf2 family transcriptional regulator [Paenibacillus cookii]
MAIVSRYTIALHILTWLAFWAEKDEFFPSDRIANSVGTSPVFLRRILGQLAKAGLVLVQHGGTGAGWKLARRPEEISLLDVYEAVVQTPLFELHHSQPNPSCIIGNGIQPALQEIYEDSEEALKRRLAQETIKDLVGSSLEHGKR